MILIREILDSKAKIRLLEKLLGRIDSFSVSELSRLSGQPKATVSEIVKDWERAGLVLTETQGRNKLVKINQKFYLLKDLKNIFKKAENFNEPLFKDILKLETIKDRRVKAVIVFGSRIKGEFTHFSDLDVLIGLKDRMMPFTEKIHEEFIKLGNERGIKFSPNLFAESEIKYRWNKKDALILNILKEGIILKGGDWIEHLQTPY